jgi:hypothetical protein
VKKNRPKPEPSTIYREGAKIAKNNQKNYIPTFLWQSPPKVFPQNKPFIFLFILIRDLRAFAVNPFYAF